MIYSRAQVAAAVHHWGQHGSGRAPLTLTRESSKLVDILGTMDFHRQGHVDVPDDSERGRLLLEAAGAGRTDGARLEQA